MSQIFKKIFFTRVLYLFLGAISRSIQREMKIGTWNVRNGLGMWRIWVRRGGCIGLGGETGGKEPLGRPRRRCVDNIRMDLQEVGCAYMDWIGLVHYRDSWRTLVSAVMNLRVP